MKSTTNLYTSSIILKTCNQNHQLISLYSFIYYQKWITRCLIETVTRDSWSLLTLTYKAGLYSLLQLPFILHLHSQLSFHLDKLNDIQFLWLTETKFYLPLLDNPTFRMSTYNNLINNMYVVNKTTFLTHFSYISTSIYSYLHHVYKRSKETNQPHLTTAIYYHGPNDRTTKEIYHQ